MHDGGSGLLCVRDSVLERAVGRRDRAGVVRVVEVDRRDVFSRRPREVGSPSARGSQRQETHPSPRERRRGGVVRVIRIGQNDGFPLVSEHERELDNRGLGAGDDGDLGVRIELDAVVRVVPHGESRPQLRQPPKRRVPVDVGPLSRRDKRIDDVARRTGLGIFPPKIDERLAFISCDGRDAT